MPIESRPAIVLASGSPYRRELLQRLRVPFEVDVADVDESALPGELPEATALRLSRRKAETVAARHRDAVVVGSDQVAECDGEAYGKPGNHEAAVRQLQLLRGRVVRFHSGLCVVSGGDGMRRVQSRVVATTVHFRMLGDDAIERYLRLDTPYDCAGSARSEGLGILLLDRVESGDPTALVGLPLIALVSMLQAIDYPLLSA